MFNNLRTIRKESLPKDTNDLLLSPTVRDWKPFIIRLYGTLSRSIYPGFVLLNHLMAVLWPRVFSIYRVIRISYGSWPVEEPVISNLTSQPLAEWLPADRCLEDPWHSCWGPRSSGYDVICGSYDSTGKYGLRCCWFSRWRICITNLQFWIVVCKQAAMHPKTIIIIHNHAWSRGFCHPPPRPKKKLWRFDYFLHAVHTSAIQNWNTVIALFLTQMPHGTWKIPAIFLPERCHVCNWNDWKFGMTISWIHRAWWRFQIY